jgi:hypothetical protein
MASCCSPLRPNSASDITCNLPVAPSSSSRLSSSDVHFLLLFFGMGAADGQTRFSSSTCRRLAGFFVSRRLRTSRRGTLIWAIRFIEKCAHGARLPAIFRSRGRAFFIPRRGRRIERGTLRNACGAMGRTTGSERQPGGMVHSFGVGLPRSLRRRAAWIRSLRFLVGGRTFLDVRRPFPGHYSMAKAWDTRFGPRRKSLSNAGYSCLYRCQWGSVAAVYET